MKNLHGFAKKLLSPKLKGTPKFEKELADEYFRTTYSNKRDKKEIIAHQFLARPPSPDHSFDHSFPDFGFDSDVVGKKSNKSAPGVNGNGYVVYKLAGKTRRILWKVLRFAWKHNLVASSWQVAWIRLLQKSDNTSHPSKMRPISILNVEGRIFFSIVNKRLSRFLLDNKYIDVMIQKGFIAKTPGCIEFGALAQACIIYDRERRIPILGRPGLSERSLKEV